MTWPSLSVVMPVHNERRHIDESIRSILRQTFAEFEFVIGDNGSTDGTIERLREWSASAPRIRILTHPTRLGPALSSNWVVNEARGELIARMDADDVAHPERLARQLAALESQPDAELIGTLFDTIDVDGHPVCPAPFDLLDTASAAPPFCHPTILFRRSAFDRIGGYRDEANYWEDADLFLRMAEAGHVYVLADVLLTIRHKLPSRGSIAEDEIRENALEAFYRNTPAFRKFDPNKAATTARRSDGKLLPQVFASRAARAVWAGQRPRLLRRMIRGAGFSWNRQSAASLIYVIWGTLAPLSLRKFLVSRIRRRCRATSQPAGELVRWQPEPRQSDESLRRN